MNVTDELRQRVQGHLDAPMPTDVYYSILDGLAGAAHMRERYERTCPCGAVFIADPCYPQQRFCSHGCAMTCRKAAA